MTLAFEEGSANRLLAEAALLFRTEDLSDKVLAHEPSEESKFETVLSTGRYARSIYYKQELRERE